MPVAIHGERLERFLAELADAPDAATAAQRLTDAFAGASAAECVLLYLLDDDERTMRLAARSHGAGAETQCTDRDDRASQPLFAAALSLFALAGVGHPACGADADRAWALVPLPQPRLSFSSALLDATAAHARAGDGWTVLTPAHGERRGRVGLAPLGVVALRLAPPADPYPVIDGLLGAATLAGPILSRGLAVEQYREAAARVERQRELLTRITDSLPDPVLLLDSSGDAIGGGRVLAQNRRAARLLDVALAADETQRRSAESNGLALGALLADGLGTDAHELSLVDPAVGAALTFEVCEYVLSDRDAGARLVVLRDVTALRGAAAALEAQARRALLAEREATRERDQLDRIFDYVADPIVVTDGSGAVVESNRQAERLLRVGRDEGDAEHEARRDANLAAFLAFARDAGGDPVRRGRLALVNPATGNALPIEVVTGTIAAHGDEPPAVVSVLHDLTTQAENERLYEELKRFSAILEARVRAATADLEARNAQLETQSAELERANRLKSEFLASMSHELRTPINALIGYSALLRDRVYGDLTPKQEDGLRRIHASAEQLLTLISDILDLARIEAGRMPVHLERTALAPVLRDATVNAEAAAQAKGLGFTVVLPDEKLYARTDPSKLRQVVGNLVSNAVKFTPHGRVTVRAARDGDVVRIDVTDTGIGIDTDDQRLIWDDFRQLDQSRTREYGGTGLGLSIVKKLAERLEAQVSVTSAPGEGSTFTVRVPAADADLHGP